MKTLSQQEITQLLVAWSHGDRAALDELLPLVYAELRRLAHRYMRRERNDDMVLQTTALVNEAYLKLIGEREMRWQDRAHFFAVSSLIMRRILVDYARKRKTSKRGGGVRHVSLEEAAAVSDERATDLIALDAALNDLATVDARRSRIAELRFFAGLTIEETAEVLEVSPTTIEREWRLTRAWLHRALRDASQEGQP
jgi:RNA polymerase sigma factor (TIGR02999 family)